MVRAFEEIGLEIFGEPSAGMFIWARFPQIEDALTLAETAARDGIMLARRRVPAASRTLAVDAVQRRRLRRAEGAALAAAGGGRRAEVVWRFRSPHYLRGKSEMRTSEPKPH